MLLIMIMSINHGSVKAETYGDYVFTNNGWNKAVITDYKGSDKDIVIPDTLNGWDVVTITDEPFFLKGLTSVVLPKHLETIYPKAFGGNRLTSVVIPEKVRAIPAEAFYYNQLSTVKLPDGLREIGVRAFQYNSLSNVVFPEGLTHIWNEAFFYNNFTEIVIPNSVTFIGTDAFSGSRNLKHVIINNPNTQIQGYAFETSPSDDPANVTIYAPVSSTAKGFAARMGHRFEELIFQLKNNGDGTATIMNYIGSDTDVEIPNRIGGLEITKIAANALSGYNLTSVIMPDSIEEIGDNAFANNSLTSIVIPQSVISIGNRAFQNNNLSKVTFLNPGTVMNDSILDDNQANPSDLSIVGYRNSTAESLANRKSYTFVNSEHEVFFSNNGNGTWQQSHATEVKVVDYDETKKLEYVWSVDTSPPVNGWTEFTNGETITKSDGTGKYFLHIRGDNLLGSSFHERTNESFYFDNEKPEISITPSSTSVTHDDVVLTVNVHDRHSGVKHVTLPDGSQTNSSDIAYIVKTNGTYKFKAEDYAGNQTTEEIKVNNIDKTISLEVPEITNIGVVKLSNEAKEYSTNMPSIKVKDWRETDNDWHLKVSASRLKMTDGDYELPTGTIKLSSILDINQVVEGNGNLPSQTIAGTNVIDNGQVTLVKANDSRGEFNLIFPDSALIFLIDPTTAIVNDPNGTTYETTITWDLITAP